MPLFLLSVVSAFRRVLKKGSGLVIQHANDVELQDLTPLSPSLGGPAKVSAKARRLPGNGRQTPRLSNEGSDAIYYRDVPGQIMRVAVRRNRSSVTLDIPTPVARPSSLLARVGFDIPRDGKRLLMVQEVKTDEQRTASLAVVQNWLAGVKK